MAGLLSSISSSLATPIHTKFLDTQAARQVPGLALGSKDCSSIRRFRCSSNGRQIDSKTFPEIHSSEADRRDPELREEASLLSVNSTDSMNDLGTGGEALEQTVKSPLGKLGGMGGDVALQNLCLYREATEESTEEDVGLNEYHVAASHNAQFVECVSVEEPLVITREEPTLQGTPAKSQDADTCLLEQLKNKDELLTVEFKNPTEMEEFSEPRTIAETMRKEVAEPAENGRDKIRKRYDGKDHNRGRFGQKNNAKKSTGDEKATEFDQGIEDEKFMREALVEAKKAALAGEVPVGAVIVSQGTIVARGYNRVESEGDPTAHAEMLCIRSASKQLGSWRLLDATLYVTLEPCPMCAGALLQARVGVVVWGARNTLLGADGSWVSLLPRTQCDESGDEEVLLFKDDRAHVKSPIHPFNPNIEVRRGVLAGDCSEIMRRFFQKRRKEEKEILKLPPGHWSPNLSTFILLGHRALSKILKLLKVAGHH